MLCVDMAGETSNPLPLFQGDIMIKVYAVGQIDKTSSIRYTTPKTNFHVRYGRDIIFDITHDIAEAKHYDTAQKARNAMLNFSKRLVKKVETLKTDIAEQEKDKVNSNSYWMGRVKDELKCVKKFIADFTYAVYEHQVDEIGESNTDKVEKKRLKWEMGWQGQPITGNFEIITETTNKHYCKLCGLKLKNIPQVKINNSCGWVLCARCAGKIGDEAKQAWASMPEVEAIDQEIFLHAI